MIRLQRKRVGFTLFEMLVVVIVIIILIGLLLPAVQKVREAANRVKCAHNLMQLGLALHNYDDSYGRFPPAATYAPGKKSESWSVQALLLPYLEEGNLYRHIDFAKPPSAQPGIDDQRIQIFLCPSDNKGGRLFANDDGQHWPHSYAVNRGTWFIYDPQSNRSGDGAFGVNQGYHRDDFTDGLSNTLGLAEVQAATSYLGEGGNPSTPDAPPPASADDMLAYGGQKQDLYDGFIQWSNGSVAQTGLTTVFTPNTTIPYSSPVGLTVDNVNFLSSHENAAPNLPTYAAMTARSYHTGVVNVFLMDGSVRSVNNGISLGVWRALGTRAGGEVVSDF
jgi:type II secretory pathway pseudopilin PulG